MAGPGGPPRPFAGPAPLACERGGALRLLLYGARDASVLVVLDDLQAADQQTVGFIDYAVPVLESAPLVILGAIRTGEAGSALSAARALGRRGLADIVSLSPLRPAAVRRMAGAILGGDPPDDLVAYLAGKTGGNPLLVEQVLEGLAEAEGVLIADGVVSWASDAAGSVPLTTLEYVEEKLGQLSADARALVGATAVAGRGDIELLKTACALEGRALLPAVGEALGAGLVNREGRWLSVRHALIQEALVQALLETELRDLRRRIAETLLYRSKGDPESLEVAAGHLEASGDRARAAELLTLAARLRLASGATVRAEASARLALKLVDQADARQAARSILVDALSVLGRWQEALEHDRAAPHEGMSPARLARMARNALRGGSLDEAEELIARAEGIGAEAVEFRVLSALLALERGDIGRARASAEQAVNIAENAREHDLACEALYVAGRADDHVGRHDEAAATFERLAGKALEAGLPAWRIQALMELGQIDFMRGAPPDRLRVAAELARSRGLFTTLVWADIVLIYSLWVRGEFDEADRAADEADRKSVV